MTSHHIMAISFECVLHPGGWPGNLTGCDAQAGPSAASPAGFSTAPSGQNLLCVIGPVDSGPEFPLLHFLSYKVGASVQWNIMWDLMSVNTQPWSWLKLHKQERQTLDQNMCQVQSR